MPGKEAYDQAVYSPRASDQQDDEESVRLRELYALIQLGIGHALEPRTFRAIAKRQAHMRHQQEDLVAQLVTRQVDEDGYLSQLALILESWADDTRDLLGPDNFRAIFGDSDPRGLVDRATFLAHQQQRLVPR